MLMTPTTRPSYAWGRRVWCVVGRCALWFAVVALWVGGAGERGASARPSSSAVSPSHPYYPYIQRIRQQLRHTPRSARLHTVLGRLYQRANAWSSAEASYRKALSLQKNYSHALVGLAQVKQHQGQTKTSRKLLEKVLRRQPRHGPALAARSEWFRYKAQKAPTQKQRKRWLKRAVRDLQRAVRVRPKAHAYRYRLGVLRLALQHHVQAHRQFAAAVALRKVHPCYHLGLAMTEAMLLRKASSYKRMKRWLPRCGHPLMGQMAQRAWMAHQIQRAQKQAARGDKSDAIQRLRNALKLAPDAPSGYLYLTLVLSQAQRCREARATLRQLLQRFPKHAQARALLRHPKALRCRVTPRSSSRTKAPPRRESSRETAPTTPSPHAPRRIPSP